MKAVSGHYEVKYCRARFHQDISTQKANLPNTSWCPLLQRKHQIYEKDQLGGQWMQEMFRGGHSCPVKAWQVVKEVQDYFPKGVHDPVERETMLH